MSYLDQYKALRQQAYRLMEVYEGTTLEGDMLFSEMRTIYDRLLPAEKKTLQEEANATLRTEE